MMQLKSSNATISKKKKKSSSSPPSSFIFGNGGRVNAGLVAKATTAATHRKMKWTTSPPFSHDDDDDDHDRSGSGSNRSNSRIHRNNSGGSSGSGSGRDIQHKGVLVTKKGKDIHRSIGSSSKKKKSLTSARTLSSPSSTSVVKMCYLWNNIFAMLLVMYVSVLLLLHLKIASQLEKEQGNAGSSFVFGGTSFLSKLQRTSLIVGTRGSSRGGRTAKSQQQQEQEQAAYDNNDDDADLILDFDVGAALLKEGGEGSVSVLHRSLTDESETERLKLLEEEVLRQQQQVNKDANVVIRSCRWKREMNQYTTDPSCPRMAGSTILYYNPSDRDRYLCGRKVKAKSVLQWDNKRGNGEDAAAAAAAAVGPYQCEDAAHGSRVWPVVPDLTGQGVPATAVRFNHYSRLRDFRGECDIPCQEAGDPGINSIRTVDGTDWQFTFSMEGPEYYHNLRIQPAAWKDGRFYSTTSYQSEVPLPYYSWAEYKIQQPAVNYDTAEKAAAFLARNCASKNNREDVVRQLQKSKFRIDSLSSCLHNADPPDGVVMSNKVNVMQHYLFYLAFENQCVDDYITEKLWGPFEAGTVPVYYGAPNAVDHVPPNSTIFVQDFDSIDALADHLATVAANKELYNSYHAWRTKPLPATFHAKYDFTAVHSTCRTCRWAYARQTGLGWNHANQSLTELRSGNRRPCLNEHTGLLQSPVQEDWSPLPTHYDYRATGSSMLLRSLSSSSSCRFVSDEKDKSSRVLTIGMRRRPRGGQSSSERQQVETRQRLIRRTVYDHDGVTDIVLEGLASNSNDKVANGARDDDEDFVFRWRFVTPLFKEYQADTSAVIPTLEVMQPGYARMQDNQTRITFLSRPVHAISNNTDGGSMLLSSPAAGQVVWTVPFTELPITVRVIVEDLDLFHDGADTEENYFGAVMRNDFFNPVESFTAVSGAAAAAVTD